MTNEFTGGAWIPSVVQVFPHGIRLKVSEEKLEFHIRYGLNRFFGPWTLERLKVQLVFREPSGLAFYHSLGILVSSDVWWSFYTYHPEEVLDYLEELGYPVDPDARRKR